MKEFLPRLYPGQVNDKNNSLTTSPKQSSEDKTNLPKGDDDQNCCYQGTEAENSKLSPVSCIKCRSVQKILMQDIEKHKKLGLTEDKNIICNKCSHLTPPAFHFVPEGANAVDCEKHEKSPSETQKTFKVKNFLPGKYYCDKCRFSTKDPLQYKKHVGQHEQIKFICSHCSYVSYTKGEFQRHLVKHTGTFPYQCEYCEYGAVRHDYIVKHTRRVHETPTKRLSNTIINHKQKKPSQSTLFEKQKYNKIPFQNELSNSLVNLSSNIECEIPGKATKTICSSHYVECSVNTASVQDKMILEPSEIIVCENQSVEVEVYSPKTEPLQPGMPLTVIAPSELVVPSNCLAQIVEIKIVNGAQQLVLKLIPMKEATYKPVNSVQEKLENQGIERSADGKKPSSVSRNELLTMEMNVDKLSSVSNQLTLNSTYDKISERLCFSASQLSDCNSVPMQREDASKLCFHLVKGIDVHSGVIELRSPSLVMTNTEKNSDLNSSRWEVDGKNNLHCDLFCYEESVEMPPPKNAAISEDKSSKNISVEAAWEGKNSSAVLKQKDTLPLKRDDKECRSLPVSSAETHLGGKGFDKKSVTSSEAGKNFHVTKTPPCKDLTSGFSKVKRAETISQKNNLLLESLELQKMENKGNPFEGPVISSVFSLSTGAENVPEGVRWDDTTCNKKSATLLCRKIAQLMSTAESNMKSMPLRCQTSSKKVIFPQENSASCERVLPATEVEQSASLPQVHGGNSVISSEEHSKDQLLTFARTAKSRVTKNSHVATPVFIPKGTMLRVLNATVSQNSNGIENGSETSAASVYCNEMFLPRPVPVSVPETLSSNLPCLPNQSELNAESRSISLRQRPKREASVKNNSKQTGALFQKSSDVSKQRKRYSRRQLRPKNKAKQASLRELPKRKTRTQSETSSGSDMSYLWTARRLRLVPLSMNQLIKCPRRNQPVVVLNHPDVDSPEIINVMKTINKYKGQVLKVVLSERTSSCLGVKRYRKRLTLKNAEIGNQAKKQSMLKMKLKKTHKNNYQVVETSPAETLQFKCWFCGRVYMDQEEWISHGQRHLIEATKGWDVLSLPAK
ncbi:Z518B protein, partial [Nyctibius bracteatus]|nr:Z518B protein [Nyctibius bracteatus]